MAAVIRLTLYEEALPLAQDVRQPWDLIRLLDGVEPPKISTNPAGAALLSDAGKTGIEPFALPIDPSGWRRLDRAKRFERVILLGAVSEYTLLLQHLMDSPDWTLSGVDGWGFVFQRGGNSPFAVPPPSSIGAGWNPRERAEWLARYAANLAAIGYFAEAAAFTGEARKADADSAMPWAVDAVLYFRQKRYEEALKASEKALSKDHRLLMARQMKVSSLLELQKFEDAYRAAENLVETSADFYSLTLGARVAHSVHAYETESGWLERAIAISEKQNGSTGGLHILLGQAYAKQGFAPQSIEAFETALKSPDLTDEQRKEVEAILETVRRNLPN